MAYNDACNLLHHITIQEDTHGWFSIGHRATDSPCRTFCNPAFTNGLQPDLIIINKENHGHAHLCTIITETTEHLNAWLARF